MNNLPKTWEEYCQQYPIENYFQIDQDGFVRGFVSRKGFTNDKAVFATRQIAEAFLALMQLIQLRDCYRQGWVPDWEDDLTEKYIIANEWGEPTKEYYAKSVCHILSFQTEELRDQFFENFKDLIEQAKELI